MNGERPWHYGLAQEIALSTAILTLLLIASYLAEDITVSLFIAAAIFLIRVTQ